MGAVTLGTLGAVRATGIGAITSGGTGTTLVVTASRCSGAGTGQLTSAVSGTISIAKTASTWSEIETGQKDNRMALLFQRWRDLLIVSARDERTGHRIAEWSVGIGG
jgi:hypothetical protein